MYEEKMAAVYDQIHRFKDYGREAAYVNGVIRQRRPDAKTLLETACGTGAFLELFLADYSVEGLDASEAMLKRAATKLPGVPLHHADMTAFDVGKRFDVVCCLFRSIALVVTPQKLAQAVLAMSAHLNKRGVLLIEPFFSPDNFWDGHVAFNRFEGDPKIAWMHHSRRLGPALARFEHHHLVGTRDGIDHFTDSQELGLFTRDDFEKAFAAAGLSLAYDDAGPSGTGLYIGTSSS